MDGELPAGWTYVALGQVARIVMGQAPPGEVVRDWNPNDGPFDGPGLPFIQGNAEFGRRFPAPVKWCEHPNKIAEPGDYLISVRAPVGELSEVDQRLAIGRGLAAIRFHSVDQRFGWQALFEARHELERVAQGSTFEAINSRDLADLRIPCPRPWEQAQIAAALDSIDVAIECAEAALEQPDS